ncbi:MAG: DUF1573 domain-containing protein [Bacteroidales bacterium]|nr:DUF1573 domain-containing protein [Bacteroidales bacterium]
MSRAHPIAAAMATLMLAASACGPRAGRSTQPEMQTADTARADLVLLDDFYDFGKIRSGEVVSISFRFKNGGSAPLIIKDVLPDCGCTSAKLPKRMFEPQEQGTIEVEFNSKGWHGSQYKQVTLRTNAPIREKSVTIRADVV